MATTTRTSRPKILARDIEAACEYLEQHGGTLAVLESADRDPSLIAKGALNFVIVGAGPTGAEMAGTLGDMTHRMIKDVYKDLDLSKAQIFWSIWDTVC